MSTDRAAATVPVRIVFPALPSGTAARDQAGYTEGHAAGYAAGMRAACAEQRRWLERAAAEQAQALTVAQQELEHAVQALSAARRDFAQRYVQALHDAEEVLAGTALDLAEAILGYELAEGSRTARAALDRALAGSDGTTVEAVRLNPADIEVLRKEGHELPAGLPLLADSAVERGDAYVDYPHGTLDAGLRSALERVRAALREDHFSEAQRSVDYVPGDTR